MLSQMNVEVTDTFGGESNYSWVRRYSSELNNRTNLAAIRKAKKLAGWNGLKCRKESYGEMIALYPYGMCQVMFITFDC
jgi:hypothetical protein